MHPTCRLAYGPPLGLLERELQGGVQRLEAVLQGILLVKLHELLAGGQQDRCSPSRPTPEGAAPEGATSNSSYGAGGGLPGKGLPE